jgi:ubiquinone biosynthesis protein UbiJ
MIGLPAIALINHLLARERWASDRLAPFVGRRVRLRLAPLPDLVLEIRAADRVQAGAGGNFDLSLAIPPAAVPRILAQDEAALREVGVEGDAALANAVLFLFRNLRWDVEEDLSRMVGDVAAHRITGAARGFAAWQREAGVRLGQNVAEYLKDEAALLVHPHELETFGRRVDALRDDVERLEKRVQRLTAKGARDSGTHD